MIGIGTLVNAGAILAGASIGVLIKGGIPDRIQKIIFSSVGVAVIFIGIMGVIDNAGNSMMLVISLVIGGVIGELLKLEERIEDLGNSIRKVFVKNADGYDAKFAEGFMTASVIFVVGAMAIMGSLNDGLLHDPSMLYTKAILDGMTAMVLASTMGFGVAFSALPVLVYQGLITVLARFLAPVLTDELIRNMAFVGNAIIFCIGVNFLWPKKIKTGNLFLAMFLPIVLQFVIK